jgi:hypothetical protein
VTSASGRGAAGDRLAALLGAQRLLQALALPRLALALEPALAADREGERRPVDQRLRDLVEALARLGRERRGAGANSIVDVSPLPPPLDASSANGDVTALTIRLPISLKTMPASENCGSLSEPLTGRSMSITPFLSASSATASLTGRFGGRALDLLAERELVEDDPVARAQLPVGLHDVGEVDAQLAALDAVARVLDRVRRQRRELELAHLAPSGRARRAGERVDLAGDLERRRALDAAAQVDVGELRRPRRRRLRRDRAEPPVSSLRLAL